MRTEWLREQYSGGGGQGAHSSSRIVESREIPYLSTYQGSVEHDRSCPTRADKRSALEAFGGRECFVESDDECGYKPGSGFLLLEHLVTGIPERADRLGFFGVEQRVGPAHQIAKATPDWALARALPEGEVKRPWRRSTRRHFRLLQLSRISIQQHQRCRRTIRWLKSDSSLSLPS